MTTSIVVLAVLAALWIAAVIWLIDEVVLDYTPDYLDPEDKE
jgi:hypothetical protein